MEFDSAAADPEVLVPELAQSPLPTDVKGIITQGGKAGLKAFLDLAKVIVPTYFVVAALDYSGIIHIIAKFLAPAMALFGLPGEAAIVLLSGWFLSIYSALGALKALALPSSAVTAIALMVLICHAVPIEWAVLHKMGARAGRITLIRFIASILAGLIYALITGGLRDVAPTPAQAAVIGAEKQFLPFFGHSALSCAKLMGLVLAIIVPISIATEWARAKDVMPTIARWLSARLGRLNPGEGALVPLLIGLLIGIVYGAGALIAFARAGMIKSEQARTVGLFLGLCHSILEDPLLFIAIGGSWFWLIIARFIFALLLMPLVKRWA
jgi:spore maturation protein SpmB